MTPATSQPRHQRFRRLILSSALVVGLATAALASPASAEGTTTSTWASIPLQLGTTHYHDRVTVSDGQVANAGKSVFIRWQCNGQVVQEATLTLVVAGNKVQGSVPYPSFFTGPPPPGCVLSEQWPNSLGARPPPS